MYRRLNITLPDEVLARADAFARASRYTRSGLIAAALEAFVADDLGAASGAVVRDVAAPYGGSIAVVPDRRSDRTLDEVTFGLRAFFSARDDIEAAWVFGSVARGTSGPMSDVDIAVLPRHPLDAHERWQLRLDLMARLPGAMRGRDVDVAVLPDVSVTLGFEIASQGVLVVGEASRPAAEAMIAAINDYWDFTPTLERAREALRERMRDYAEAE